jgi:hypothetical protein
MSSHKRLATYTILFKMRRFENQGWTNELIAHISSRDRVSIDLIWIEWPDILDSDLE